MRQKTSHPRQLIWFWFLVFGLALAGCDHSSGGGASDTPAATAVIDSAGGTLTGPDGVQVVVPPGALTQPTTIGIARKSDGAPAALDAYPVAGHIYELTPHDLPFNLPVTIRMPVPDGAPGTLYMASPGQGWSARDATVVNGVAEWQSGSFSWVYWSKFQGISCSIPAGMEQDPYWCQIPVIGASGLSATPAQALTLTTVYPSTYLAGRVDQAATLHFQSQFNVAGNCKNVTVKFFHLLKSGPLQLLLTQSPALTVNGSRLSGTATFDFPFTDQDNGANLFRWQVSTDCPGVIYANGVAGWDYSNYRHITSYGDATVAGNITPPTVFYTLGGSVTGLTGTGLVLQNNNGDNLAVAANGAFTFATSVGARDPYNVTVFTQPALQTCTVTNGSGTANADVTNVAVSCGALALAVSPAVSNSARCPSDKVTLTASGGTPPYSWTSTASVVPYYGGVNVINATQAQWYDGSDGDGFCNTSGTVTITATDSVGATASAIINVQ